MLGTRKRSRRYSKRSAAPKTTVAGHTFIAPVGWSVSVRGRATIITAPEGDSHMALVDVQASDAANAVAAAWAEYKRAKVHPLEVVEQFADKDGWTDTHRFTYRVPPNERRFLIAEASRTNEAWQVTLIDMSRSTLTVRDEQHEYVFVER